MATLIQSVRQPVKPVKEWKGVPLLDAEDAEIIKFNKSLFNQNSPLRRWHMQRMARNLWFYRGRQWFEIPRDLVPTNGGYFFRDITPKSSAFFKTPTDNMIGIGVDNEVARLGVKEYVPSTYANHGNPELEAAARMAKDILLSDLQEQRWPDSREGLAFELMVYGMCVGRSVWDETVTDVTILASPDAVQCPACGARYGSKKLPADALSGFSRGGMQLHNLDSVKDVESDEPGRPSEVELAHCPACASLAPLLPYKPSQEEAQEGEDMFGRPLGLQVPSGEALIGQVSPFEIFVQNGGVGVEPATCTVWGQETPRSMEWVATHYPDVVDEIDPDSPQELVRNHPLLGDRSGFFTGSGGPSAQDVYANSVMVREVYADPVPISGLECGRWIVQIKDRIVTNEKLVTKVEGPDGEEREIPRAKYWAVRCKRIPGEFWGVTPVDDAVPLNRRLNELDFQVIDLRERGRPRLYVRPGTILQQGESLGSLEVLEVDSEDPNWSPKDSLFPPGGQPLTGDAYLAERNGIKESIREKLGPQDVEQGINPTGANTVGQVAILQEQAAIPRGPKERGLTEMYEALWTHHMQLTWAFRKEDASYQSKNSAGVMETKSYNGNALLGQTDVKVKAEGTYDKSLIQAAGAEKAIGLQLYDVTDQASRDKILDLMNLPKVNEMQSVQVKRAELTWVEFLQEGCIPVLDPDLVDPWIWFQVLGKRWQEDEGVELQDKAEWDECLKRLAGWQEKYQKAMAEDAQQRQIYDGHPAEQWQAIYQQGAQAAQIQSQAIAAQAQAQGQPPPPPQTMPQPPASGQFLSDDQATRLLQVWHQILEESGWPVPTVEQAESMELTVEEGPVRSDEASPELLKARLLEFYATIQTCLMLSQQRKQQAMTGAPIVAAPGGARTEAGMEPTPGANVQPSEGGPTPQGGPAGPGG